MIDASARRHAIEGWLKYFHQPDFKTAVTISAIDPREMEIKGVHAISPTPFVNVLTS